MENVNDSEAVDILYQWKHGMVYECIDREII